MMNIERAALGRLGATSLKQNALFYVLLLLIQGGTSGCRVQTDTLNSQHAKSMVPSEQPVLPDSNTEKKPFSNSEESFHSNTSQFDENAQMISNLGVDAEEPAEGIVEEIPTEGDGPSSSEVPIPAEGDGSSSSEVPVEFEEMNTKDVTESVCHSVSSKLDQVTLVSPKVLGNGPVRFVATTRRSTHVSLELVVLGEDGKSVQPERYETWGVYPRAISAYFSSLSPGVYTATLEDERKSVLACLNITVPQEHPEQETIVPMSGVWSIEADWSPAYEDLYSVFVAKLFYVRPGGQKGWRPLHQATRDPFRNILYGSFGLDEDNSNADPHVRLEPDCADAPFQLRAYFAWKMGLPFMFNRCNRGTSITGPECYTTHGMLTKRFDGESHPVSRFNAFASTHVGWKVHSGNGRTVPKSDTGDVYPVGLTAETIRPGAVFVDAGGHLLLVSQVEPQSESRMGVVYGIDAHPDRTVTHKQFGIGTFVFNHRVPTDGFKLFRPVVRHKERLRFLSNRELTEQGFTPWADEQSNIESNSVFYDRVGHVFNPKPLDPVLVLKNKIDILHKALLERVEAVAIGVAYMKENNWRKMAMPNGAAIFQTEGPWEIYSTPARDMRVFLALDDVMSFPKRVAKNLAQYAIEDGQDAKAVAQTLTAIRDETLKSLSVAYERSDGTLFELSLFEVMERQERLEMAYNPNDCIERRWGAPENSEEMSTCTRKAPPDQRFKMKLARRWFSARRRPDQR